jgi:hypothetical protein
VFRFLLKLDDGEPNDPAVFCGSHRRAGLIGSGLKSCQLGLRHVAEGLDRHAQALLGVGWKFGQRFECEPARDFHADQRLELGIVVGVVRNMRRYRATGLTKRIRADE